MRHLRKTGQFRDLEKLGKRCRARAAGRGRCIIWVEFVVW